MARIVDITSAQDPSAIEAARIRLVRARDEAQARLVLTDQRIEGLRRERAEEPADDEHDPEGSTLSGEWQRIEALRRSTAAERAEVDAALARVAAGTYGVCVVCGADIPEGRLEARPFATMCVVCAAA